MTPDEAAEIVAALERLGVDGPATALDVLEVAPINRELGEVDRAAVLERLLYVQQRRAKAHARAVELTSGGDPAHGNSGPGGLPLPEPRSEESDG